MTSMVLAYHALDESGSVVSTSREKFRQQMQSLADAAIPVVGLDQVVHFPGAVAITFDDGYVSVLEHGIPVLAKHGFPSTTFVVTAQCGKGNDWDQRGRAIPKLPVMSWTQLRELLLAGMTLGSHSHTHPRLNASNAREELQRSKQELEDHLGIRASLFCYPYGEADTAVREAVAEQFECACTTELAFVRPDADPLWLPRIDAYYAPADLSTLFTSSGRLYLATRALLRKMKRWLPR